MLEFDSPTDATGQPPTADARARARPTHDGKLNTSLAAGDGEETSMVSCSEQDGFDDKGVGEGGRHGSAGSCCAIAYDSSGASRQPGISTTHRTTTDDRQ